MSDPFEPVQQQRDGVIQRELLLFLSAVLGVVLVLVLAMLASPKTARPTPVEVSSIAPILQMNFPNASKPVQHKLNAVIARLKMHPDDSQALVTLGMTLMAHELKSAAIPCFELMAQREPQDFRWPYLLGHCRMFTDPEIAAVHFQRATHLQPDYVPAQMLLVEVLLSSGRTAEAQQRLDHDLPASIRKHPWVAWQTSRLASMLGDFRQSEELLDQLRAKGIVSKSLLRQLLMVKHRTQKDADLQSLTDELAACPQELLVWECPVIQAVRAEKIDYQTVFSKAQASLARRDFQGAIEVFRRAMEVDPESPELMINLAQLWLQAGDLDRADGILQVAETFEHGSLRILVLRSRIAVMKQDWANAKGLCEQAIALKPDSAEAWYVMAVMQNEQKQLDAARDSVKLALRLDPMNSDAQRLGKQLAAP